MSDSAVITGRVTNASGAPEQSVAVRIMELSVETTTVADGSYRLVIPASRMKSNPEQVRITASRVGLSTQTRELYLSQGGEYTQNFQLGSDAIILEGEDS